MSFPAIRPLLSPSPPNLREGERDNEEDSMILCGTNQATGNGSGKQPNFLQKLFDFLALEPHPYPDIIYWAADSKQLVIARPDDLARDVLPRLFKHDKVSSFGRQLNIYGFARVYPGRQFKDAQGNILDASVWAHPTLHRLSTADEVASIKRRAAPKLFRTRRLANGQIVRTRAGRDVERKFYEIKEDMANERRSKHGWGEPSCRSPVRDRSPSAQPLGLGWMQCGDSMVSPSNDDWAGMGTPLIPVDELTNGYGDFPPSFDPHQDPNAYNYPLASISEDVPPSPEGLYLPSLPLITHQDGYYHSQDTMNPFDLPTTTSASFPQSSNRFYRSCPASIHTSPIQAHKVLDAVRPFPPSFSTSANQRYTPYQLKFTQVLEPTRIAAPAAIDPFSHTSLAPVLSPITPYSLSADITPPEGLSREGSVYPEMQSWERTGIIDPRWVSPWGSKSAWTTPAVTPRTGSPVNGHGRGQTPAGVQMFPTSYGRGGGGMSGGRGERGGMGPPPIPSSAPTSG